RGLPVRATLIPLTRPGEREAEIVARLRIGRVAREGPGQPAHRPGWLVRCDAGRLSPVQRGRETPSRFIDLDAIRKPAQTVTVSHESRKPLSVQLLIVTELDDVLCLAVVSRRIAISRLRA